MYYVKHQDQGCQCVACFTMWESANNFLQLCHQQGRSAYITKTLR
jgi:hypothetical protein